MCSCNDFSNVWLQMNMVIPPLDGHANKSIIIDAYPFLSFSDLTCHLEDTGIGVFWLRCAT